MLSAENSSTAGLHARHHIHSVDTDECDEDDNNLTTWGYGDGTTETIFNRLHDLTKRQYDDLLPFGVAIDLDAVEAEREARQADRGAA